VRDLLLGRPGNDWDIATDLLPDKVARIFPRHYTAGARFGTVAVLSGKVVYEVTTFRLDGIYTDGRRPDSVAFSTDLNEDLVRRDFTVNALAYDPLDDRLEDPTGGMADLEANLIRAVGIAEERFREDGLRLMRAVRFSAQLGFEIEDGTYRALVLCADRLEPISAERIREELDRLLLAPHAASGLALLHETGLLRRFLPELSEAYGVSQNRYHAFDVFNHTLAAVDGAPADNLRVRLAALFHDLGKPESRSLRGQTNTFYNHQHTSERIALYRMRELRYSNAERRAVAHLVRHHMFHYRPEWNDSAVRRFLREVGAENLTDLFALRTADSRGKGGRKGRAPELAELQRRIDREIERASALNVRDLAIGGAEVMQILGCTPGPAVGRILKALLEEVVEEPERNTAEYLSRRAAELGAGDDGGEEARRDDDVQAGGDEADS